MEEIVILRVYKSLVGVLGILGNLLVCVVILKVRAMQTRTNAFILNQAVVDFFGSVVIILQTNVPLPDPLPQNAAGWIFCHIWISNFMIIIFFVTSTFNLLSLTMERYFAIVHPYRYQATFASNPRMKVGVVVAFCWIIGVVIKIYTIIIAKVTPEGECIQRQVPGSKVIGILTVFIQYILPVCVMLFAYIRTSVELKRQAARCGPTGDVCNFPGAPETMTESLMRARRNTFKTLLIVFITFLVCWSPNQIIFLLWNFGWGIKFKDWYFLLSLALVASNSCVNPFIYALKYKQFRNGVLQLVGKTSVQIEAA